jgi:hypothetical protein
MSDLHKGEVEITLAGVSRVLKPSLAAFSQLAHQYGNHTALHEKLLNCDIAAQIVVLRRGLNMSDADAKKLPELVFHTGAHALRDPLVDYAFRLFNNGLSAEEWLAQQMASQSAAGEGDADENPLLTGG